MFWLLAVSCVYASQQRPIAKRNYIGANVRFNF